MPERTVTIICKYKNCGFRVTAQFDPDEDEMNDSLNRILLEHHDNFGKFAGYSEGKQI